MKKLKDYMSCEGCAEEVFGCYEAQQVKGVSAGLEFGDNHLSFFVIDDKTGKFIVPFFEGGEWK